MYMACLYTYGIHMYMACIYTYGIHMYMACIYTYGIHMYMACICIWQYIWKNDIYLMCTLFAYLYVLLKWGPHMVSMETPYIFDI